MPTGWRPKDVSNRFPKSIVQNVNDLRKYAPKYTALHKFIAVFQFVCLNIFVFILLSSFGELNLNSQLSFGLLILTSIFGFTSLMDGHKWAFFFEISRGFLGFIIILYPFELNLWENYFPFMIFTSIYFIATLLTTFWIHQSLPERSYN